MKKLGIISFGPKKCVIFYVKKVSKLGDDEIYFFNKKDVLHSSSSVSSREWEFLKDVKQQTDVNKFEFSVFDYNCTLSDNPHEFIRIIFRNY